MFPAGVTSVPFAVMVTNDDVQEGDEKFSLIIDQSSLLIHPRVTVSNPDHVTVTIYDDDDDGKYILKLHNIHLLAVVYRNLFKSGQCIYDIHIV